MALPIPNLTFTKVADVGEVLTKDQVTNLITEIQRAHKTAVDQVTTAKGAEISTLEAKVGEYKKAAEKLPGLERQLSTVQSQHERYTVNAGKLQLTNPEDAGDMFAIYQSRTAGQDKPPTYAEWVAQGIAAPDKTPATVRSLFEAAAKRAADGGGEGGGGGGADAGGGGGEGGGGGGRDLSTGGGRGGGGGGGGGNSGGAGLKDLAAARKSGMSATEFYNQRYRPAHGMQPVKPVDTAGDGK